MIRATLLTEGSSDQVLLPILRWLLASITEEPVEVVWADLRGVVAQPRTLTDKVRCAGELYPCDLLFVHRDRDNATVTHREDEIRAASSGTFPVVPVIPVQTQEAWLLIDESALRQAAHKPTGQAELRLPKTSAIERLADPKGVLYQALRAASEATGRRAKRFSPARAAHRLASTIDDWSPLRQLTAFKKLTEDTRAGLSVLNIPSTSPEL